MSLIDVNSISKLPLIFHMFESVEDAQLRFPDLDVYIYKSFKVKKGSSPYVIIAVEVK